MVNNCSKLGFLANLGFSTWPIIDVCECLSDIGYSAVGWTLAHFNPDMAQPAQFDLIRIPEQFNLSVSELVVQQDFVTLNQSQFEDRIDLVKSCINLAANIGVENINLFTGPAPWDPDAPIIGRNISESHSWDLVNEAFSRLIPVAENKKVYLCVEAVFGQLCHDYYTLMELFHQFDSQYLAVNLDPSHYKLYDNDLTWVVRNLKPYIRHVHLKDVVGKPGKLGKDFTFPMLGEGTINWAEFSKALDEIHYKGFCSIEFESFNYYYSVMKDNPKLAAEMSFQQAMKLFQ